MSEPIWNRFLTARDQAFSGVQDVRYAQGEDHARRGNDPTSADRSWQQSIADPNLSADLRLPVALRSVSFPRQIACPRRSADPCRIACRRSAAYPRRSFSVSPETQPKIRGDDERVVNAVPRLAHRHAERIRPR
jgi:hypothetical protein